MRYAARHFSSAALHSKSSLALARAAVSHHTLQATQQADARISADFWGCDYLTNPVPVHLAAVHLPTSEHSY